MQRTGRASRPKVAAPVIAAATASILAFSGCATPQTTGAESDPAVVTESSLPAELQTQLQAVLDETMAEYDVPGAVAGVWLPESGNWVVAAGLADIEQGEATTIDMSWPLRSVTKSFTVTLLLQLVDDGKLSLDDTISDYVDGVTDGDQITLRQLANMSSGVADYTNEDFAAIFSEDPARLFTLNDLNSFMLGRPAQFAPGSSHVYTNANTNLIGALIEKVTGQPFDAVLSERILTPLGLADTRYMVDVTDWTQPHASGYGPAEEPREAVDQNFSILGPAGSMVSTLEDARVWAETLASGALLEPATQAQRQEGAPLESGPPYDLYALGMGETNGWWGHNGEGLGYTAAVFHDPETGASIVVFMNESNLVNGAHPADQTFRRFAEVLEQEWTP